MRRGGSSIGEIASAFHRSKSLILSYVRDVKILPEFQESLRFRRGGSAKRAETRRQASFAQAVRLIDKLTLRDQLLIAACLYWGEGNKRDFSLSNTDPRLIETFLSCLIKLGVRRDRFKVSIRIYEDIDEARARRYWAKIAGISPTEITSVNVLSGKKLGKAPYGMCRVRLTKGNDYFHLLMAAIRLINAEFAPVAQRIELRTPNAGMQVRLLPGALMDSSIVEGVPPAK